jgi:hypothetical protein
MINANNSDANMTFHTADAFFFVANRVGSAQPIAMADILAECHGALD